MSDISSYSLKISPTAPAEGWHYVIAKALDHVSLAKQIETNIGWFGPERQ